MVIAEPHGNVTLYSRMNETELVRSASVGQREAYTEIYGRYGAAIQTHIYCIIKDPREAEDLTQIIFGEKLPANIEKLSEGTTVYLQAWLYRVARNMAFNLSRDRKRRDGILGR